MCTDNASTNPYNGFEQGPIRPPSEARSLLLRITRGCPWNRCTFCPVYKASRFSVRPVEHVKQDIDLIHKHVTAIQNMVGSSARTAVSEVQKAGRSIAPAEWAVFAAAAEWLTGGGGRSVFLQDADALVIKPDDLVAILRHLRRRFPGITRVTSYARSQTIARRNAADLAAIRTAGLDRIHVGLESASNDVLAVTGKGATKEIHIAAGLKARRADMELSEYVMPGLGGRQLSRSHAVETADALNQINPHFIRLRQLAIPAGAPLCEEHRSGAFCKCTDREVAAELLLFIDKLDGITSAVTSDHILNLFMDLQGTLPKDKDRMTSMLRNFQDMAPEEQRLYQVGRRTGIFSRTRDMQNPLKREAAEKACRELGITADNVDAITDRLMTRFV
ncbi:MAG: radical SAM protein [Candidatus Latescibacterota bacterium]